MAILDINTNNVNVSWVIRKNPQTQIDTQVPFEKKLRQGKLYGWYQTPNDFRMYFKDGEGKSSFYKDLNNDYLDQSAYNCPYVYCAMMNEMLSSALKEEQEKDINTFNKIILSSILITSPHIADAFIKYFSDKVHITMENITKKVYSIIFEGNVSLYYITNLVQMFCLVQALEDRNIYIDTNEGTLKKYAQTLINIEAPYFIVYLFLSRCVPDMKSFLLIKPILEKEGWILHYGNTQKQRFNEIKKHIVDGEFLNDIGCGELYYSRNLASFYKTIYSWDADSKIQERNKHYINKKQLVNIQLKNAFTEKNMIDIQKGSDILITEMLEHIPKEEATKVLLKLKNTPFRNMIITVPNKDFNQFYKLEHEFRHDDHCWEPTYEETVQWIDTIFGKGNACIKPIGDGINGIHLTTLITIKK